ncbi:MAG TPA: hypothetical protein VE344_03765 [Methylomirabilota bacterium]|nr:hypothetical protein [Methylomirabilota bacterium]
MREIFIRTSFGPFGSSIFIEEFTKMAVGIHAAKEISTLVLTVSVVLGKSAACHPNKKTTKQ